MGREDAVSRNEHFAHGHSPLSGYLAFAENRPSHASAREVYQNSIPADTGMTRDDEGRLYRPLWGEQGMTPDQVMEHKYAKAEQRGIKDDVLNRGVINPIRMVADGARAPKQVYESSGAPDRPKVPLLWNGQHRLAVMLQHNPDAQVPLEWGSFEEFDANEATNRRYNKPIPTSEKPVTLPKRRKK
jgi:hypothetical protein